MVTSCLVWIKSLGDIHGSVKVKIETGGVLWGMLAIVISPVSIKDRTAVVPRVMLNLCLNT